MFENFINVLLIMIPAITLGLLLVLIMMHRYAGSGQRKRLINMIVARRKNGRQRPEARFDAKKLASGSIVFRSGKYRIRLNAKTGTTHTC